MTPTQGRSQTSATDIHHYEGMMLNLVYNFTSIFTTPVEMLLRPTYGSRYFPPAIQFLTSVMIMLWTLFSSFADGFARRLPFGGLHGLAGMFGIATIAKLYFAGSFIHGFRVWRRMIHPERELHSEWEERPLPIFKILPWSSWWVIRIIYEPIFVFVTALVLQNFFILQDSAAHYLMFAAVMLVMKQYCAWYMGWTFLRDTMDIVNLGPIIAKMVTNTATEDELASINMASIPKDFPDDLRKEAAAHIARANSIRNEDDK